MKPEEQIYALMGIAEEQQRLITRHLEQQEISTAHLLKLEQQYIQDMQVQREIAQREFEQQLEEMSERLSDRVGTGWILVTTIFCFTMAFVVGFGAYVYLDSIKTDIVEARAVMADLKVKKADLSRCKKDGKYYPCIRVMKSWGSYGKYSDYYIIDEKG